MTLQGWRSDGGGDWDENGSIARVRKAQWETNELCSDRGLSKHHNPRKKAQPRPAQGSFTPRSPPPAPATRRLRVRAAAKPKPRHRQPQNPSPPPFPTDRLNDRDVPLSPSAGQGSPPPPATGAPTTGARRHPPPLLADQRRVADTSAFSSGSCPISGSATAEPSDRRERKREEEPVREAASKMSDDVIWHCIRHNHCSFMAKITTGIFCRNPYNATGICNRSSCPLANSRYATIRDHDGIFYLYMKTAERAHLPNKLWERVKLPRNYEKAMEVINKHLEFWPKLLVHKIKQRLTKMTQYRIRMRKLQLKVREKVMTVPRKKTQRDLRRMEKAEKAAQLDKSIESELKERLKKGVYGDIYNYPFKEFDTILDMEKDDVALEEEEEEEGEIEYVEGDEIEMGDMEDMEDFEGVINGEDGGIDKDDLLDEPVSKKHKGSGSDLKSKRWSTKVITEVEQDEDTNSRQRTRM